MLEKINQLEVKIRELQCNIKQYTIENNTLNSLNIKLKETIEILKGNKTDYELYKSLVNEKCETANTLHKELDELREEINKYKIATQKQLKERTEVDAQKSKEIKDLNALKRHSEIAFKGNFV